MERCSINTCRVLVVSVVFFSYIMLLISSPLVATTTDAQVEAEVEALCNSTWWWYMENTTSHHCTWNNITCNQKGHVIQIYFLDHYKLVIEFSTLKFSLFSRLPHLNLSHSYIQGRIPDEIVHLQNSLSSVSLTVDFMVSHLIHRVASLLEELDLSVSFLFGAIPPSLAYLKNLIHFGLSSNPLSGAIPPSLGYLKNLIHLDLSLNFLSGAIPPSLVF